MRHTPLRVDAAPHLCAVHTMTLLRNGKAVRIGTYKIFTVGIMEFEVPLRHFDLRPSEMAGSSFDTFGLEGYRYVVRRLCLCACV